MLSGELIKVLHVTISAFQGAVVPFIGMYSTKVLHAPAMNGLACISWCINYLSCVGVVIEHNGGNECLYMTSIDSGQFPLWNREKDQYLISRVCIARSQGEYCLAVSASTVQPSEKVLGPHFDGQYGIKII